MSREILFRAKRIDNGEWVEGFYVYDYGHNQHLIFKNELVCPNCINDRRKDFSLGYYEVAPSTVCQYTGLTDKNGKKIWENDIVYCVDDGNVNARLVVWDKQELDFKGTNGKENYGRNFDYLSCCEEIEVIGNIFDHKELSEVDHE